MSGPKTSTAVINRQQLNWLMQNEKKRMSALMKQRRILDNDLCAIKKSKDDIIAKYDELIAACGESQKKEMQNAYNYFIDEYNGLINSINRNDIDNIEKSINSIRRANCISSFREKIYKIRNLVDRPQASEDNYQTQIIDVKADFTENFYEYGMEYYIQKLENAHNSDKLEAAKTLLQSLNLLLNEAEFLSNDKETIQNYHDKLNQMIENNQYQEFTCIADKIKKISSYVKNYHDYVMYAMELNIVPINISDFRNAEEIKAQLEAVKNQVELIFSHKYIENSINEVMSKHGYMININLKLKGAKDSQENILDAVYESKNYNSHIRVLSCVSGHTVMEIVGDYSSEAEKEKRHNEQAKFCKLYPEIIKELQEVYGIEFTNNTEMPVGSACKEIVVADRSTDTAQGNQPKEQEMAMR